MLDYRQRKYAYQPLTLPDGNQDIFPVTLRSDDGSAQPGEQPEDYEIWAHNQRVKNYGQYLAQQVSIGFFIDPAYGIQPVVHQKPMEFPGKIIIQEAKAAIRKAKNDTSYLALWSDRSKVESGGAGTAVVWKIPAFHRWEVCKTMLGENKQVLDAELWGISQALKVALKEIIVADLDNLLLISWQILAHGAYLKINRGADRGIGMAVEKHECIASGSEPWLHSYTSDCSTSSANLAVVNIKSKSETCPRQGHLLISTARPSIVSRPLRSGFSSEISMFLKCGEWCGAWAGFLNPLSQLPNSPQCYT